LRADDVTVEEIRLPAGVSAVGATLGSLTLPDNVSVMAILAAEGGVRQNRAETTFLAGDQVLLLVQGTVEEQAIRDAFGVPHDEAAPESE
ncbi:hypothetical protein EG835_02660, partial [bacterium]|nr:hypothetical protein [bacterium]